MSFTDISSETRNSDYNNISVGSATLISLNKNGDATIKVDDSTVALYLSAVSLSGGKPVCLACLGSYFIPESYADGKMQCSLVRIVGV